MPWNADDIMSAHSVLDRIDGLLSARDSSVDSSNSRASNGSKRSRHVVSNGESGSDVPDTDDARFIASETSSDSESDPEDARAAAASAELGGSEDGAATDWTLSLGIPRKPSDVPSSMSVDEAREMLSKMTLAITTGRVTSEYAFVGIKNRILSSANLALKDIPDDLRAMGEDEYFGLS